MAKVSVQNVTVTAEEGDDLTAFFSPITVATVLVLGVACYRAEIRALSSHLIPGLDDLDETIEMTLPNVVNETITFELEPVQIG